MGWNFNWRRSWFEWELPMVHNFFQLIAICKLGNGGSYFFWIWKEHGFGNLTMKSTYGYLLAVAVGSHQSQTFESLWNLKIPLKIITFVWRALWNADSNTDRNNSTTDLIPLP